MYLLLVLLLRAAVAIRLDSLGVADAEAVSVLLDDLFQNQENLVTLARSWREHRRTNNQMRLRARDGIWTRQGLQPRAAVHVFTLDTANCRRMALAMQSGIPSLCEQNNIFHER